MKYSHIAAAALLSIASAGSMAMSVTLTGTNFDVTYDSAALGLFGSSVTLTGDQLSFFPTSFVAKTGSGIDVTNSTVALMISAHSGYSLTGFSLAEGGDYFHFSNSAAPMASGVSASGQLRVTPLPGSTTTAAITPAGAFTANSFLNFGTTDWTATASVAAPMNTTLANVSIQNILAAYVVDGVGYSFIEKKDAFLTVGVTPVPEPETWAMMLAGLAAVGFLARRRG